MGNKKPSGNVFGNGCQIAPQQHAEEWRNHSIPLLQTHISMGIADGSIQRSNAELTHGQVAGDGTTVPTRATVAATVERLEHVSRALDEQIADWLLSLLPPSRPRRVARMLDPGGDKYRDIPKTAPFTPAQLLAHARSTSTYATTLDQGGMSRAGVIEVDQGGRRAVQAALAAAERLRLWCFAIAVDNPLNGHAGGHVWFQYAEPAPVAAIAAQLRAVATAAGLPDTAEIWPCNQVIRLPFGYHRWAQTRGALLTQDGEIINLDADLAGGFDLVMSLPTNAAPPAMSTIVDTPKSVTVVTPRRVTQGELSAERASLADVRASFNRAHSLEQLLCDWGAVATPGGFSCPCGVPHSHATTLYISRLGKLFSYSPQCKLYTTKGYDAFGFYVKTQHNDDINAALRTLNPISDRANSALVRSLPEYVLSPEERARRAAEAQRKKAARKQHAAETIADVRARAAADETLTNCDRAVLDALLTIAGDRDWCRPSKEQIAKVSGIPVGTVKRTMFSQAKGGRLEGRYFVSKGNGGGANATAIRTFLRGSISDEMIHESLRTCDLVPDSEACERGADPPRVDPELLVYVHALACAVGVPEDYTSWSAEALEAEALRMAAVLDSASGEIPQMDSQIETPAEPVGDIVTGPAGAVAIVGGAAYVPAGAEAWYQAMQQAQICAVDSSAQLDQAAAAPQLDEDAESAPLILCPPDVCDRRYVTFRKHWFAAHQMSRTPKQRAWFLEQANRLLQEAEPAAAARRWAPFRAVQGEPSVSQAPLHRRRAAPIRGNPQMPAGAQLSLELLPMGNNATGFALSLVEASPPLTSS